MDIIRHLRAKHVILGIICFCTLLGGRLAENGLPATQLEAPQDQPEDATAKESNLQKDEGVGSGVPVDAASRPPTQDKEPDSPQHTQNDEVVASLPPSPPEAVASPAPPGGGDGQTTSGGDSQTHPHVLQDERISKGPEVPNGSTVGATPGGDGTKAGQADARQDLGQARPETPDTSPGKAAEASAHQDTKPADSAKSDVQAPSSQDAAAAAKPAEQPATAVPGQESAAAAAVESSPPTETEAPPAGSAATSETEAPPAEKLEKSDPSEPVVQAAGDEMPSFDEWKEKMLAQQAKLAQQVKEEAKAGQPAATTGIKYSKPNRVNYASMSCGAKVVGTNPETKNAASILNENKDQYMIQPCVAKKWFVVELCEPIAVKIIEIANLELFSSLPKSFIVHVSERYPTKDWRALGTFHARDERAVQSFSVQDEDIFAKYLKVEPLTHYGAEHYCPLTILRAYGTTPVEVEDYEDAEVEARPVDDDGDDTEEGTANLFTTATDTVLSLVKTVLNPQEEKTEGAEQMEGLVKLNQTVTNQSLVNDTSQRPQGEQAAPCTPSVQTQGSSQEPPSGEDMAGLGSGFPRTPYVTDKPPLVTLIESRPHSEPLSHLLTQCNYCQHPTQPICYADRRHICGYFRAANFVRSTSCGSKARPRRKKPEAVAAAAADSGRADGQKPAGDQTGTAQVKVEREGKTEQGQESPVEPTGNGSQLKVDTPSSTTTAASSSETEAGTKTVDSSQVSLEPSQDTLTGGTPLQQQQHTHTDLGEQSMTSQTPSLSEKSVDSPSTAMPTSTPALSKDMVETTPRAGIPSSDTESCDPSSSDCSTMGPDVVQIRPTSTEEVTIEAPPKTTATIIPMETKAPPAKVTETATAAEAASRDAGGVPQGTPPEEANKTAQNGQNGKIIYAEPPSPQEDYDLEYVPLPDDSEPIQKVSSGRRETVIMRLRNRIKALELNLNLSSRYLEELSQRYRRKMENMYVSLNKTIQKLSNTSRTAELRDVRQQANITELTKRINFLTEQVEALTNNLSGLHTQVIERHLFLMMIEGVIFSLIIAWLLNRLQRPPLGGARATPTGAVSARAAPPSGHTVAPPAGESRTKPPDKARRAAQKMHRRRNSIDATPPRPRPAQMAGKERSKDDISVRLSGSESGFGSDVLNAAAAASASDEFKEIVNRKRKRKKQKSLQTSRSTSNISSGTSSASASATTVADIRSSSTSFYHRVGLLFSSKMAEAEADVSPSSSSCGSENGESSAMTVGGMRNTHQRVPSQHQQQHHHHHQQHHQKAKQIQHRPQHTARRSLDLRLNGVPGGWQQEARGINTGSGSSRPGRKSHQRQRSADGILRAGGATSPSLPPPPTSLSSPPASSLAAGRTATSSHSSGATPSTVTNVGPLYTGGTSTVTNGKAVMSQNGGTTPQDRASGSWKGWLLGTRN